MDFVILHGKESISNNFPLAFECLTNDTSTILVEMDKLAKNPTWKLDINKMYFKGTPLEVEHIMLTFGWRRATSIDFDLTPYGDKTVLIQGANSLLRMFNFDKPGGPYQRIVRYYLE